MRIIFYRVLGSEEDKNLSVKRSYDMGAGTNILKILLAGIEGGAKQGGEAYSKMSMAKQLAEMEDKMAKTSTRRDYEYQQGLPEDQREAYGKFRRAPQRPERPVKTTGTDLQKKYINILSRARTNPESVSDAEMAWVTSYKESNKKATTGTGLKQRYLDIKQRELTNPQSVTETERAWVKAYEADKFDFPDMGYTTQ